MLDRLIAFVLLITVGLPLAANASTDADASHAAAVLLVNSVSQRLVLAHDVALIKWDAKQPIEDQKREELVLSHAVQKASPYGLSAEKVKLLMADQIAANKLIQRALFTQWRDQGGAPSAVSQPRTSLQVIREQLDQQQGQFLQQLSQTAVWREQAVCQTKLAQIVEGYVQNSPLPQYLQALDLALRHVCDQKN